MGQGGNVQQWEEIDFNLLNNSSSSARGIRGGVWFNYNDSPVLLSSSNRVSSGPTGVFDSVGFRVASTPEPSTLLLAVLACGAIWWSRKRFNA